MWRKPENHLVFPLGGLLGRLLGLSWGVSKASWTVLGPSWASWTDRSAIRGPLSPSWRPLWALLARLGASEARKGENPTNIEPQGKSITFASRGLLGKALEALLGRLEGFLGRLEAILGHLGPS